MIKSVLKWGGRLTGMAFLLYFGYFYYSMATGTERVGAVCSLMKPGMPFDELVLLARTHGLGPGVPRPDAKLIYLAERRSYGRHACRVELENGVVTNATYNFAD